MNTKSLLWIFLLVSFALPSSMISQTQTANPDLTRMRLLLAIIEDCSKDQKELEAELEAMEKQKPNVSYELYMQAKENLAIASKCKARAQREYDDLKADYEGWFKSSTSAMSVDRERITPGILEARIRAVFALYLILSGQFNLFAVPEH